MAERPDETATLATIQIPSLVIVGAEDAISTCEEMLAMAETIPN